MVKIVKESFNYPSSRETFVDDLSRNERARFILLMADMYGDDAYFDDLSKEEWDNLKRAFFSRSPRSESFNGPSSREIFVGNLSQSDREKFNKLMLSTYGDGCYYTSLTDEEWNNLKRKFNKESADGKKTESVKITESFFRDSFNDWYDSLDDEERSAVDQYMEDEGMPDMVMDLSRADMENVLDHFDSDHLEYLYDQEDEGNRISCGWQFDEGPYEEGCNHTESKKTEGKSDSQEPSYPFGMYGIAREPYIFGIYGDRCGAYSSLDELVKTLEDNNIKVTGISGDEEYGWEFYAYGIAKDVFKLIDGKVPGYNCDDVADFVYQYAIDPDEYRREHTDETPEEKIWNSIPDEEFESYDEDEIPEPAFPDDYDPDDEEYPREYFVERVKPRKKTESSDTTISELDSCIDDFPRDFREFYLGLDDKWKRAVINLASYHFDGIFNCDDNQLYTLIDIVSDLTYREESGEDIYAPIKLFDPETGEEDNYSIPTHLFVESRKITESKLVKPHRDDLAMDEEEDGYILTKAYYQDPYKALVYKKDDSAKVIIFKYGKEEKHDGDKPSYRKNFKKYDEDEIYSWITSKIKKTESLDRYGYINRWGEYKDPNGLYVCDDDDMMEFRTTDEYDIAVEQWINRMVEDRYEPPYYESEFVKCDYFPREAYNEFIKNGGKVTEDTVKKSNGKWTNKGKDGEHGEFKSKKAADAQRKAMFANGYKESVTEASARKPKFWNSQFAVKVIKDYKSGKLTKDNIKEWDREQNDGKDPNPPFNTREIIDYYNSNSKAKKEMDSWIGTKNESWGDSLRDAPNPYDNEDEEYSDFGDGSVSAGDTFIEDGIEYEWVDGVGDVYYLDFDSWQVWEASPVDDVTEDGDPYGVFFVVDIDTGFIDWGPCDTVEEAKEFLQSKVDDYNNDEDEESGIDIEDEIIDESIMDEHNKYLEIIDEFRGTKLLDYAKDLLAEYDPDKDSMSSMLRDYASSLYEDGYGDNPDTVYNDLKRVVDAISATRSMAVC